MNIGRLESVLVRELWKHEQYDFSTWLSKEENISLLGDELGLSFTDIEVEKFVGNYRCDIVAIDDNTGKTVIIENQLEPSNHDHLGKIITYASGLDASTIIWIVTEARSEHKSAIEWLNLICTHFPGHILFTSLNTWMLPCILQGASILFFSESFYYCNS